MPKGIFVRKPLSEEHKRNISVALMGRIVSPETREKMRHNPQNFKKGHTVSLETRMKMRNSPTAFKPGHEVTDEMRAKLRKASLGVKPTVEALAKRSLAMRGENNPSWKGGVTELRNAIRNCFKYRLWRFDIFKRDNFTCVWCGARGVYLEADHNPIPFYKILIEYKINTIDDALACEKLWDISNGRTLCKPCHNTTKNGRAKN